MRRAPGRVLLLALTLLLASAAPATGRLTPSFRLHPVGGSPVPPAFSESTAFVLGSDGRVRAVDRGSGRERWQASVRCGADLFALSGERLVCAQARSGSLRVLDASSGALLAHERVEGGPYLPQLVEGTLVLLQPGSGRILGYDVVRRTWTFDHRTDMDLARGAPYTPVALGGTLYFTQDEWRTLWALEVAEGRVRMAVRSDTPVRTDDGRDAWLSHGLLLSRDESEILAFDLVAGKRAWRAGPEQLGGRPLPGPETVVVTGGSLFALVERAPGPEGSWSGHAVVEIRLHGGERRRSWSLDVGLPWLALAELASPARDEPCALGFTSITVVDDQPAVTLAYPCDPPRDSQNHGWVLGLAPGGGGLRWRAGPRLGERLVPTTRGLYALWGDAGVPFRERRLSELAPDSGEVLASHAIGQRPAWSLVRDEQLWLGTQSGPVRVFLR